MKKWLKENIFVKDMFVYILIACIIFYSPSWISLIYAFTTGKELYFGGAAAWVLLWAGPLTPTIPIILAIAIGLKQIVKRIKGKKANDETIS